MNNTNETNYRQNKNILNTHDIAYSALGAVLIAICAFITVPSIIPFTLQTMGIFIVLNTLGKKRGFISILAYTLLGAIGLPVFSGMKGGIGVLMGTTGGYIIGFIFTSILYCLLPQTKNFFVTIIYDFISLLICYFFGTLWFVWLNFDNGKTISFIAAFNSCVLPFIIPDLIKIFIAVSISFTIKNHIK